MAGERERRWRKEEEEEEMRGGVHLKRRDTGIYKQAALQKS